MAGVVPGLGHAPAAWARQFVEPPADNRVLDETGHEAERERLRAATAAVGARLAERAQAATGAAAEVLAATAGLATDRGWLRPAQKLIGQGRPASAAASQAIDGFITQLEALGGLMAERTTDLKDVRDRVLAELLGLPEPGVPQPSVPIVLLATDLAPADTAGLDPEMIVGLATSLGGPSSHTAIIARQLGIPCVVGVAGLDSIDEGEPVIIDGDSGTIRTGVPTGEAEQLVAADRLRRAEIAAWRGPAQLASGEHVQLLVNVQDGASARQAAQTSQAEGVGLFRTELSFLSAQVEPDVAQQAEIYRGVLDAYPNQKVVIRTLDAGSDKPVPFASLPDEENPALGVRGIRLSFTREGLLDRQLDAIALARQQSGDNDNAWVMAPMIATLDEARRFATAARQRGLPAGIMVEVPAVAVLAEDFLAEVDFMSIGTNDLTQYTMAADRLASELAHLTGAWQPAVLHLIARTAAAGVRAGKPVGICGEAAADPLLACVLTGLGVTSLSMAATAIPAVGAMLATVSLEQARAAAEAALGCSSAEQARAAARQALGG